MLQELEAAIGISKPVRYLSSFRVGSPFTAGWWRPVVLFPATLLAELNEPELRTIIAHELAHVKRHDFLVNLAQTLVCILFFYHPAVWWMSARIEDEREHCCDDLAVKVTGERVGYARTLIQLKEREAGPAMAMGFLGKGGGFKQRVTRLLSGYLGTGTYGEGFTSAVIIACIMIAAVTLSAQSKGTEVQLEEPLIETSITADPVADKAESTARLGRPPKPEPPKPPRSSHIDIFDENTTPEDIKMPTDDSTALIFLLEAVGDGNVALVRYFINQGVDVNAVKGNWTPLMVAASENHVEVLQELIKAGAKVNFVNRHGWTALIEAADEGSYECAEALIKAGADVNLTGAGNNRTPLAMAGSEGHTRVFSLLVQKGADVFSTSGKGSPLHEAAEEGMLDIVKRLIDLGADAGARDEYGRAALSYAAEEGNVDVVRYLLSNGANPNDKDDDDRTALIYGAHEGQAEVVKALLAAGAQATMKDRRGMNALDYAAEELGSMGLYWKHSGADSRPQSNNSGTPGFEHPLSEVIYDLIKAGATSNRVIIDDKGILVPKGNNERNGEDNLNEHHVNLSFDGSHKPHGEDASATSHELVEAVAKGQNDRIDYLIERGDNLNRPANNGRTPLTEASFQNYNVHSEQLVKGGADINRADGNGYTPLTMAAQHNHTSTLDLLLRLGAKPDLEDGNGRTAKAIALRDGSVQILRLLNQKGGSVTAVESDGISPLAYPARDGYLDVLRFLLEQGTDPNAGAGKSPVFLAARERQAEAIRLLARYKANLEGNFNYRDSDYFGHKVSGGKYAVYENATPLMVALTQGSERTVKALLDAGANPNRTCRKHQFDSSKSIDVSVADNLNVAELGNRYTQRFNVSGWTPLMEAVMTNNVSIVRLLLNAGAEKQRSITGGMTALSLAKELGFDEIADLL